MTSEPEREWWCPKCGQHVRTLPTITAPTCWAHPRPAVMVERADNPNQGSLL